MVLLIRSSSILGSLRLAAASLVVIAVGVSSSKAETSVPGWTAGPAADATMDVGQRFTCDGPDCGGGFTCLYAAAPPRPPASRWLKVEDVTNPAVWPWGPVENWLAHKVNEVAGPVIPDPAAPASDWAIADKPLVFDLNGEGFARRIYSVKASGGALSVPLYFWTSKGRLFTMFCAIEGERLGRVRGAVHRLLSELHPGEPKRDIPERF